MQVTLDRYVHEVRDSLLNFDLRKITIRESVDMLLSGQFDEWFDRGRILSYLEKIAENFETDYMAKPFCKHCGSFGLKRIKGCKKERYLCLNCKRTCVKFNLIRTHFDDWVISRIISGVVRGNRIKDIYKGLVNDKSAKEYKEGCLIRIPDEKTIYDILERVGRQLYPLVKFLILIIGGIECKKLMIDDTYALLVKRRKHLQLDFDGKIVKGVKKKRRLHKKRPSFHPIILCSRKIMHNIYSRSCKT